MMKIDSSAFKEGQPIPKKYTSEGVDLSPPLAFHDVPQDTKTLALIVDDPDAPMGTFVHWLAWNIPGTTTELPEGVMSEEDKFEQGINDYKETRYRGPCPPPGSPHRYYFKLYALDAFIDLPKGALKSDLEKAIQGHILAKAELIGTFQR